MGCSDVIETVTYETETWLKIQVRNHDRDLKFETETRDLKFVNFAGSFQ